MWTWNSFQSPPARTLLGVVMAGLTLGALALGATWGTLGASSSALGVTAIFACAGAAVAARRDFAWQVVVCAACAWIAGSALSATDAGVPLMIARAVLATGATMMMVHLYARNLSRNVVLNGLTSGAATAAGLMFLAAPGDIATHWPTYFYPVADVVVFSIVAGSLTVGAMVLMPALILGLSGIVIFTVADMVSVLTGHVVAGGWVHAVAMIFCCAGALLPHPPATTTNLRPRVPAMVLASISTVVALGVMLGADSFQVRAVAGAAMVAGVMRAANAWKELRTTNEISAKIVERVEAQARTDDLTSMLNRRGFREAVQQMHKAGSVISVLMMDLDKFKAVNDTLGHAAGDALLIEVGARLRALAPPGAVPARLGGDEFAMLIPADAATAAIHAEAMRPALVQPLVMNENTLAVEVSIGVADTAGTDVSEAMGRADAAMYDAKRHRRGVRVWDPSLAGPISSGVLLAGELRSAIAEGQLVLHYQPKVPVDGSAVTSVEALVRWEHPSAGTIGPEEFIPFAESTALIHPLTEFVLDAALADAAAWARSGVSLKVAVNFSARSFDDRDVVDTIAAALIRHQVSPSQLEVEITESAIIDDTEIVREVLRELVTMGVGVCLDDFGAGYTNLAQLGEFPLSAIKIDRSLVSHAGEHGRRGQVLRATIALGRSLGFDVVAEGVEDQEVLAVVTQAGATSVQGWVHAAAMDAPALISWLAQRQGLVARGAASPAALVGVGNQ